MKKPLAYRMRPTTLNEVIGQKAIVGENGFLTNCVKNNSLVSVILFGRPGTGKTTIAEALANSMNVHYIKLNAVTSSKADLQNAIKEAKLYADCILIIDEIHRLNKEKQDLLLPSIEDGTIYMIGATTANPMISINPAIRSRTHLLEVTPLSIDEVIIGLTRAISNPQGLNSSRSFTKDALRTIASLSGGDLRYAYNFMETLALSYSSTHEITKEDVLSTSSIPNFYADKDENEHYDTVSAFQKSIRGNEVDAALYYLAKLIKAGDLEGLIRRLLVTAYEDVGLSNPQAVDRCYHACEVAKDVGLPEAVYPLSFSVTELALSPKSKSASSALFKALDSIEKYPSEVRDYLKYTPVNAKEEDKYPYDRPDLWEYIEYLPDGLESSVFYIPRLTGNYEKSLNINYERLKKIKRSTKLSELKKKAK